MTMSVTSFFSPNYPHTAMDKDQQPFDSTPTPETTPAVPELTASGKPKKRFVGKARKQQAAEGTDSTTIEDSAIAIRDGNVTMATRLRRKG